MYSLKKRLGKNLLINMFIIMLILLIAMNFTIRALVNNYVGTRLQHDVDTLISAVEYDTIRGWLLNDRLTAPVYMRVRSGHYYVIKTPDGKTIRSRSLFDMETPISGEGDFVEKNYQMDGPGDEIWLVTQSIVYKNKQPLFVWVAEDIHILGKQLFDYSVYLLIALLLLIAVSIVIHQQILDKAFRIFDRVQERLKSSRHQAIDLDPQDIPIEIFPLMSEISLLIEQLRQRIMRTRNAIGDLSHELKRPLQLLSMHIDNNEEQQTEINAIADIKTIIDRELRRAKIAGSDAIPVEFNVPKEIPYLMDILHKIYPDIVIQLRNTGDIGVTHHDRDDMLELIGNLLDNACKYASSTVILTFSKQKDAFNITVEDDGAGIDLSKLEQITKQGVRLDESKEGHGLGLRICADIVGSYNGRLKFSPAKNRGLIVTVVLKIMGHSEITL